VIARFLVGWAMAENSKVALVRCGLAGLSICSPCPWHVACALSRGMSLLCGQSRPP